MLPVGYLKGRTLLLVSREARELMIHHVLQGASEEDIGFEDAGRTLEDVTGALSHRRALVHPGVVESALWSCNLRQEAGRWWHPDGKSFDEFVKEVLGSKRLHRIYHMIEE